jgi:hypothetical protein
MNVDIVASIFAVFIDFIFLYNPTKNIKMQRQNKKSYSALTQEWIEGALKDEM